MAASNEDDALLRALGANAMGRRKVTRLLNSIAAGFLDEERYPPLSRAAARAAARADSEHNAFFASVGYEFFDSQLRDADDEQVEGFSAGEDGDTPYHTEQEIEVLIGASGVKEASSFTRFKKIQRRIRRELKQLKDLTFLNTLEQYLLAFKFDELDPGHDHSATSDAFRLWDAADLGIDVQFLPAHSRPLLLQFADSYHRMLAHGVCQFHQLMSKSSDLSGHRVTLIRRGHSSVVAAPVVAGVSLTLTLCRFLTDIKKMKAERVLRVRAKGSKYASFARRFGEFDSETEEESDDEQVEVGSPARIRPAVSRAERAQRSAQLQAKRRDADGARDDDHDAIFQERFSIDPADRRRPVKPASISHKRR